MEPQTTISVVLALCLILIVMMYVAGLEVGRKIALQAHAGYTAVASTGL
jgi:hypothetical protein